MSGAKHTPGPWRVRKEWCGDGKEVYPDRKVKVGQPSELCVVSGIYDQCAANALLIAAAPELLEALQLIVTWNRDHARDQYGDPEKAESWACVRAARAAILKATGSAAC